MAIRTPLHQEARTNTLLEGMVTEKRLLRYRAVQVLAENNARQ
jgi:hypothetical protein